MVVYCFCCVATSGEKQMNVITVPQLAIVPIPFIRVSAVRAHAEFVCQVCAVYAVGTSVCMRAACTSVHDVWVLKLLRISYSDSSMRRKDKRCASVERKRREPARAILPE